MKSINRGEERDGKGKKRLRKNKAIEVRRENEEKMKAFLVLWCFSNAFSSK